MNKVEVIVLAHGSRRKEANHDVNRLADIMQNSSEGRNAKVTAAFLQFAEPGLKQAIEDAVKREKEHILVVPLFLTEGVHINEDIPREIEEASCLYPGVKIEQRPPLGCDEKLAAIMWERAGVVEQ